MSEESVKNVSQDSQDASDEKAPATSLSKKKKKPQAGEKALQDLTEKFADLNDKFLRLNAEYDNYRKRTLKEKMELVKSGGESVLMQILPVVDNLERAMQVIRDAKDIDAVKEGIELIHSKFKDFLTMNGIREIESHNEDFDTDIHEAITKIPAPTPELKGKVVDVVEKGYFLHDKVMRFAKVVIGE